MVQRRVIINNWTSMSKLLVPSSKLKRHQRNQVHHLPRAHQNRQKVRKSLKLKWKLRNCIPHLRYPKWAKRKRETISMDLRRKSILSHIEIMTKSMRNWSSFIRANSLKRSYKLVSLRTGNCNCGFWTTSTRPCSNRSRKQSTKAST